MSVSGQEHLATAHKTTMTQEQRRELFRVITMPFAENTPPVVTPEVAGLMTDRQLHLTWLRMCEYISEELYRQEFDACVGKPLFEDKPA